ncbi:hypothetical protein ANO11243_002820 [Dothideomycetidae sp. 11243]|nr:hypothetical protein ANO11243_002820 [fungal sp. No.11243]
MATDVPIEEGNAPFKISTIDKPCSTYYRIFGDLTCGSRPLICVHGGPGAGHASYLPFADLWHLYGIPVILYDQIGCGASTHLPETAGNHALWQVSLFVDELSNLIDHLRLRQGYDVIGRSFGGYIVTDFAIRHPRGLNRLIIANGSASKALSYESFHILRKKMPANHQEAILNAGRTGDFESAAYKDAFAYFTSTFLCRTSNAAPPELTAALNNMADDKTVYSTIYGRSGISPWFEGGSMVGWSRVSRLHQINVPTLIYNSEFDTSALDVAQVPFFERIPRVRWVTIANAGHSAHMESPELKEKVLRLVGEFLRPRSYADGSDDNDK